MRIIVVSLLVVVNFILSSTLFQYLGIFGVKPDFTIILIVSYAILRGSPYGTAIGLGAGLLVDLMYGKTIGLNAISYMLTGYLIGQMHDNIFKDSTIPAVLFNAGAVFIYQNLFFLSAFLSNNLSTESVSYIHILLSIILPQCLYNAILGGIIYRYIYLLDNKKFMDKRIY